MARPFTNTDETRSVSTRHLRSWNGFGIYKLQLQGPSCARALFDRFSAAKSLVCLGEQQAGDKGDRQCSSVLECPCMDDGHE